MMAWSFSKPRMRLPSVIDKMFDSPSQGESNHYAMILRESRGTWDNTRCENVLGLVHQDGGPRRVECPFGGFLNNIKKVFAIG